MSGESSPRIAAQEFASSLRAIEFTALIVFRMKDDDGKPSSAEWREIQLADAYSHFDQCVKRIEARIADTVGTAIGDNPRNWFAKTLTALKTLIERLRFYDRVLRHTDTDQLLENEQADLERLRHEVECRAEELESAALTLPPSAGASCPNEIPNTSKPVQQPPDPKNERDAIVKTFPLAFLRYADSQSVDLLAYLLKVGLTTREDVFRDFWKEKAVTSDAARKALKRLEDDIFDFAKDDFDLVNRPHAVWVERPDKNGTKTD